MVGVATRLWGRQIWV